MTEAYFNFATCFSCMMCSLARKRKVSEFVYGSLNDILNFIDIITHSGPIQTSRCWYRLTQMVVGKRALYQIRKKAIKKATNGFNCYM